MYAGCTIGYDRGKKLKSQKRSKTDLRPTITTRASAKWASHGNPTACGWTPGFTRPGRAVYPSLPWSVPVKFHWLHGGNSHEFPLICDQHHPTATGFIGCMSSSSSLPDTQLASLIDRPNFSNLASGEQSHRRALGLHLSQLQSKLLPLGLGLTCQWGKKMHSDTFNASQPSAYDSAWFTSMSVQQLHQFHIISHYSDTIQILFRSIQTHLLCPFSSFQEFLKVGEVGHSVGTGHHPCTSSCRRWRRARPCAWPLHPWYGPWYSIIRVIIWVLPFSIVI